MATRIAEFKQKGVKNPTSDSLFIAESSSHPGRVYVQLLKQINPTQKRMMHFAIAPEDLDDLITVLMYVKQEVVK